MSKMRALGVGKSSLLVGEGASPATKLRPDMVDEGEYRGVK